jgi:hypothetical protein
MTTDNLNAPWSLHFDRDGTEHIAVIVDANGVDLATSRPFWLPEGHDPVPPTLAGMQVMAAAPELLSACRMVIDCWNSSDLAGVVRACREAVKVAEPSPSK